jgi:hypothetical protein
LKRTQQDRAFLVNGVLRGQDEERLFPAHNWFRRW